MMQWIEVIEKNSTGFWLIYIAIIVIGIIANWRIFEKAGEPGWKCLIPFYNSYTLFKIVYGNGWRFLTLLIPLANIVFMILFYIELAKSYGYGVGFACGLIFLSPIFQIILGFDSSEYMGSKYHREALRNSNWYT